LPCLDIVLQYVQLSSILDPILIVLNDWTHDEDQSEFQPAYEDFAAILLLALALIHRYALTADDIHNLSGDKFCGKLLTHLSRSIPIGDLSESQSKNFSKWIKGLYATDEHGETSGISDEVMSKCPPQDFYLLVPTLFEQSVLACRAKALLPNTLKGGLECKMSSKIAWNQLLMFSSSLGAFSPTVADWRYRLDCQALVGGSWRRTDSFADAGQAYTPIIHVG